MSSQGWVSIHRKIQDNPIWKLEPFTKGQAWIDLILLANHKDGKLSVRGNIIDVKRGQVGHSEVTLSKRWKWSRGKTRRFLKWLETEQQIEQQKTSITSLISITNYESYQSSDTTHRTADGHQTDSRQDTNNNVINENTVIAKKFIPKFLPLPESLKSIDEFNDKWQEYLVHRKQSKKGAMTELALTKLLTKLSDRPSSAVKAIDLIVNKNWTGFEWEWFDKSYPNQSKPEQTFTDYNKQRDIYLAS